VQELIAEYQESSDGANASTVDMLNIIAQVRLAASRAVFQQEQVNLHCTIIDHRGQETPTMRSDPMATARCPAVRRAIAGGELDSGGLPR
jgi:hypothetical protein